MSAGAHWQKTTVLVLLAAGLLLSVGCLATPSHVITLHDGRVYRSAQAPVLNPKTGYYKFRDRYGRDVLLRDREVSSIQKDPVKVSSEAGKPVKAKKRTDRS